MEQKPLEQNSINIDEKYHDDVRKQLNIIMTTIFHFDQMSDENLW
jgi:hypothetical protein